MGFLSNLFSITRIPIKGVNGTGTNLKNTTEKTDSPKNHNNPLYKICFNLTIKKNLAMFKKTPFELA
jgi:hypothetical protein